MMNKLQPWGDRVNSSQETSRTNFIIVCLSAKGGQGASLFALHLSSILSSRRRTLLVDLDPASSHRYFIDDPDCPGLANLAMVHEGMSYLRTSDFTRHHPGGFDLLAGPRGNEEWAFLRSADLRPIFAELSHSYEVIVVDISSNRLKSLLRLTTIASVNLMILKADLLSARSALQLIEELADFGTGSSADTALVANRTSPCAVLNPKQLSLALQLPLLASLPYDRAAGEEFASLSPITHADSDIQTAVRRFAASVGFIDDSPAAKAEGRSIKCLRSLLRSSSHYHFQPG